MATKKKTTTQPTTKKPAKKVSKPSAKKLTSTSASAKTAAKKPVKPKKAVNKTQATQASVEDFLKTISSEQQRKDSVTLVNMMKKITKESPQMWGAGMIGFGNITITSERSGRMVDWFKMGFAPRKTNLSLYLGLNIPKQHPEAMKKLGKFKTDGGCIYINKLEDVDLKVLEEVMKKGGFK